MMQKIKTARLDRLLANLGYGSRKDIKAFVRAGEIYLDGEPVSDVSSHVPLESDLARRLTIAGEPLDPLPGFVVMMHKPVGVTCSHKEAGPLVYDLLPHRWHLRKPALSTVGRLDKETSGLLLLTDDGALLHRIISPNSHVAKRYQVTLASPLQGDETAKLAAGTLMLSGETSPLKPVAMEVISNESDRGAVVAVTLHEGRYHQVRRMFGALSNRVVALHRVQIGALCLPAELAPGTFRIIGETEVAKVFEPADSD